MAARTFRDNAGIAARAVSMDCSVDYLVESSKSFSEVVFDLEPVVQRLGFVVFHREDLGETLRLHGSEFDEDSAVFFVGNYPLLSAMLERAPAASLALPSGIAVFTRNGATWIGCQRPTARLGVLAEDVAMLRLAEELEDRLLQIVNECR